MKEIKRAHFQLKETIATIIAEEDNNIEAAKRGMIRCRKEIEDFIIINPFFAYTLEPYSPPSNAPKIIKKMCSSSEKLSIGPMATVAGTIAEYAVKEMKEGCSQYAVVDNGGDIAIFSKKEEVTVGIYTGNEKTSKFALKIPPRNNIVGVCTSSGKIGPSISFGNTDAVTIICRDISVADAAATAVANLIKSEENIKNAFKFLEDVKEVEGAIAILGNKIALWGDLPEIIPAKALLKLITMG